MKKYVLALFIATAAPLAAQSYRYIDESGNIHFVDKAGDVPARYRSQILPTPTAMTPKEWRKAQQAKEALRKKKEKEKEKELKRLQKEEEKRVKDEERARRSEEQRKKGKKPVKKGLSGAFEKNQQPAEDSVQQQTQLEAESEAISPPELPAAQ